MFLTHFQFPIRNETQAEFLSLLKQSNYTHILDHMHQQSHQHRLVKTYIRD